MCSDIGLGRCWGDGRFPTAARRAFHIQPIEPSGHLRYLVAMNSTAKAKLAEIERRIDELTALLVRSLDDVAEAERQGDDGTTHLRRSLVLQGTISALHDEADGLRRGMRKAAH